MSIAFLGTGLLGSGFVEHLLATTSQITVWNRTAAKAARFAAAGARVAASPAEAVEHAARIHICVHSDGAVDELLAQIAPAAPADAVIVDHTTTSPDGAAARAARLADDGRAFLHAPVFMSPKMAQAGKGIMLACGPEAVFARVDAALATMTGDLWYLGADPRRAAAMKLAGNAMLIAIAGAMADTLALGRATGLSGADVLALMDRLKPGGSIAIRGKKMADGDFSASFELAMARKDLGLMLDAIGTAPLSCLRGIAARADGLIAAGRGADDLGVLAAPD
jgi:3-hydroxyisobutyrate dehydrogenase-like beta-hydroxyacid dehydrogenase